MIRPTLPFYSNSECDNGFESALDSAEEAFDDFVEIVRERMNDGCEKSYDLMIRHSHLIEKQAS